jgi:phosphotransferase system HPr-like phosphotransfer protein
MASLDSFLNGRLNQEKIKRIIQTANLFQSYLLFEHQNKKYNAKSVLSLGILNGINGNITIHAIGTDSNEALKAIQQICEDKEKT